VGGAERRFDVGFVVEASLYILHGTVALNFVLQGSIGGARTRSSGSFEGVTRTA
jgi:hypothetical protein